jgi:hypothetical protein
VEWRRSKSFATSSKIASLLHLAALLPAISAPRHQVGSFFSAVAVWDDGVELHSFLSGQ